VAPVRCAVHAGARSLLGKLVGPRVREKGTTTGGRTDALSLPPTRSSAALSAVPG
jgi:hypothetical protein